MEILFKKSLTQTLILFASVLLSAPSGFAYLSINETGELLQEGDFRLGVLPQFYLSDGGGSNLGAFLDLYTAPAINSRFAIGGGSTDFWAQASAKWVPFPDYQRQPAIGFRGAFIYARDVNINFYNFQITPIISKITDSEYGKMIPYVGLPVTIIYADNKSKTAMQFAIGNEWVIDPGFQVGAELDLNLSNTTTAISVHLNFPFDGQIGYRK